MVDVLSAITINQHAQAPIYTILLCELANRQTHMIKTQNITTISASHKYACRQANRQAGRKAAGTE